MTLQKTLRWDVKQHNDHLIVQFNGELTRDTLLPLWKQRASFLSLQANQHIYWDLQGLARVDSAGFALLTELLYYYGKETTNHLIHIPQVVTALAELYGLENWIKPYISNNIISKE